jgi:hypothetical protein
MLAASFCICYREGQMMADINERRCVSGVTVFVFPEKKVNSLCVLKNDK